MVARALKANPPLLLQSTPQGCVQSVVFPGGISSQNVVAMERYVNQSGNHGREQKQWIRALYAQRAILLVWCDGVGCANPIFLGDSEVGGKSRERYSSTGRGRKEWMLAGQTICLSA